ncbi:MAG: hypothetical protein V2A69_11695 [Pseudomonadota bacterium]|jgi:hypothetical protein
MTRKSSNTVVLKKIDGIERELAKLKRDVIHNLVASGTLRKMKPSLFGSVRGGDVTEKMIQESKHNLFRKLNNL